MTKLLAVLLLAPGFYACAQPYIDLVNARHLLNLSASPNNKDTRLQYFNASATLPIRLGHSKDAIIASPMFEEWFITGMTTAKLKGMVLPVTYLKSAKSGNWSALATIIGRLNNEVPRGAANAGQFGGALIISTRKNEALSFKYGLYYNREFFGNFFMPLAGIDWRINPDNSLFGVLPGNITYEHRCSDHLYWGAVFRAITNSYRIRPPDSCNNGCSRQQYLRIDDNQSAIYLDYYITKHIVVNLEAGHSLFRKIRLGTRMGAGRPVNTIIPCGDTFFAKAALAYRLRL